VQADPSGARLPGEQAKEQERQTTRDPLSREIQDALFVTVDAARHAPQ
jgi:hypothetical protein